MQDHRRVQENEGGVRCKGFAAVEREHALDLCGVEYVTKWGQGFVQSFGRGSWRIDACLEVVSGA